MRATGVTTAVGARAAHLAAAVVVVLMISLSPSSLVYRPSAVWCFSFDV